MQWLLADQRIAIDDKSRNEISIFVLKSSDWTPIFACVQTIPKHFPLDDRSMNDSINGNMHIAHTHTLHT